MFPKLSVLIAESVCVVASGPAASIPVGIRVMNVTSTGKYMVSKGGGSEKGQCLSKGKGPGFGKASFHARGIASENSEGLSELD